VQNGWVRNCIVSFSFNNLLAVVDGQVLGFHYEAGMYQMYDLALLPFFHLLSCEQVNDKFTASSKKSYLSFLSDNGAY